MATTETPLSYQSIRSAHQAREADELKAEFRKKNLLILILQHLKEEGFYESANTLLKETNIDLNRFEVCDNIDLPTILMEFESYYYVKFSRYPKITKKLLPEEKTKRTRKNIQRSVRNSMRRNNSLSQLMPLDHHSLSNHSGNMASLHSNINSADGRRSNSNINALPHESVDVNNMPLQGLSLQGNSEIISSNRLQETSLPAINQKLKGGQIIDIRSMLNSATRLSVEEGNLDVSDKLLKPLAGYTAYNSEWRDLALIISRDIYSENTHVKWDDIIGLDEAKRLVKESVVYPIKYPELFTGILSPWKGLLLFGPPGTGKTMLAKAVATECNTTFFNISASTIVSKWRGDSEKLVRVLFEMARYHAPSTIFLDELESLMSQRGSQGGSEHEGSRRMKTEILVQMDGLAKTDDLVFLLAASNLPWELDHAMLRRLEKRILVDLPTWEARKTMFHHYLPETISSGTNGLQLNACVDYEILAARTEGYSGSDVKLVCKEAAMKPVRKIFDALENNNDGEIHVQLDTLHTTDVISAIESTKSSVTQIKEKYTTWQMEHGSV